MVYFILVILLCYIIIYLCTSECLTIKLKSMSMSRLTGRDSFKNCSIITIISSISWRTPSSSMFGLTGSITMKCSISSTLRLDISPTTIISRYSVMLSTITSKSSTCKKAIRLSFDHLSQIYLYDILSNKLIKQEEMDNEICDRTDKLNV